jgi:hypothetical protein
VVVTPAVGSTVLAGLRFYPGADAQGFDPSGYILEGSNDGGTTYSTIDSGPLALPATRNPAAAAVDPTVDSVQEILFSNGRGFTTYRLTFPSIVSPSTAAYLEIAEVEFLGVPGLGVSQPTITKTSVSGGNLSLSGSGGPANGNFSVLTNASLTVPISRWGVAATGTYDATGKFSVSLPVSATNPKLFYLIQTP